MTSGGEPTPLGSTATARPAPRRPAVILRLSMPGMRPETLRLRCDERTLSVCAVGRSCVRGLDGEAWPPLSTWYEHDIELDHRIDPGSIRAELDGADAVRLVLPLRLARRERHPIAASVRAAEDLYGSDQPAG